MRDGTPSNEPGWRLRVVANRVPALRVEGTLDHRREGPFDRMHGLGAHEVIVETPRHDATWATLPVDDLTLVLTAWRDRMADLRRDSRMQAALVFKNEGVKAGARLAHPHSQLMTMPIVPATLAEEIAGARRYLDTYGRCVYCALVDQELAAGSRVVAATEAALVIAALCRPLAVRDVAAAARRHHARFELAPAALLADVAATLQPVLKSIAARLEQPALNVVLHSTPYGGGRRGGLPLAPGDGPAGAAAVGVRPGQRYRHQPGDARGGGAGAAVVNRDFRPPCRYRGPFVTLCGRSGRE